MRSKTLSQSGCGVAEQEPLVNPFLIDADSLTLGEYTAISEITDLGFAEIIAGLSGKLDDPAFLLALTFIVNKRADPDFTLVDAGAVKLLDLDLPDG